MNSSAISTSARRTAAALTTAAIALSPVLLGATSANAAPGDKGRAGAVVLRTNLNVKALNSIEVPLDAELNDVSAPANESESLLNTKVKGLNGGKSFNMLRAEVATADAKTNSRRAVGQAKLAHATVKLPGLGSIGNPLVEARLATAKALCVAGERPVAKAEVVGLKVLGKSVPVELNGTEEVEVPGVGTVTLGLAETRTTSRTAAATALRLTVNVKTLDLAKVRGSVILSQANCRAPLADDGDDTGGNTTGDTTGGEDNGGNTTGDTTGGEDNGGNTTGDTTGGEDNGGNTTGGTDGGATTGGDGPGGDLAETGSSSTTPYLAAGAGLLMVAGAGALVLTRRRKAVAAQQD